MVVCLFVSPDKIQQQNYYAKPLLFAIKSQMTLQQCKGIQENISICSETFNFWIIHGKIWNNIQHLRDFRDLQWQKLVLFYKNAICVPVHDRFSCSKVCVLCHKCRSSAWLLFAERLINSVRHKNGHVEI